MRVFSVVFVLCLAVVGVQLLALRAPGPLTWGFHHYAYLPSPWLLVGIAGAAVLLLLFRSPPRFLARLRWPGPALYALLGVVGGAAFWFARERNYFMGDGQLWINGVREGRLLWYNEPGSLWGHYYLNRLLGSPDPAITFAAVSVVCGVLYIWLSLAFARLTGAGRAGQALVFSLLALSGITRLFYGYAETYPLLAVAVLLYAVLGVRYVQGKGSLFWPALVATLAIPLHVTALALLPSLLFIVWRGSESGRSSGGRWGSLLIPAAGIGVGLFLLARTPGVGLGTFEPFVRKVFPLGGTLANNMPYTLLSPSHFLDFLEEQILLGPFAALLVLALLITGNAKPIRRDLGFLLWAGLPWWIVSFAYNREIGAPRDWDLFAVASLPLLMFGAAALARHAWWKTAPAQARLGAGLLAGVTFFHTLPWVALGAYDDRSLGQFAALYGPGSRSSDFARAYAFETLSTYYLDRGDLASAEVAMSESRRLDPGNVRLAGNLGSLRVMQGRLPEALEVLEEAAERAPNNEVVQYQLAGALKESGRLEEASAAYQRAIDLNPDFVQAHLNKAQTERLAGRLRAAEVTLRTARRHLPEEGLLYTNLARIYQDMDRLKEAAANYREGLKRDPTDTGAAFNLGRLLMGEEDFEGAIEVLSDLVGRSPSDFEAWINLGVSYGQVGRRQDAEGAFRQAMEVDPRRGEPYFNLAQMHADSGDTDRAVALLRSFTARDSTSRYGLTARALIRRLQTQTEGGGETPSPDEP